jgi:hypothetical protein
MSQSWKLVDPDGKPYTSAVPGTLGGHRRSRIYGRLDCPIALRAIARDGYVTHRVFFLDSRTRTGRRVPPLRRLPPKGVRALESTASRRVGEQASSCGKTEAGLASRRSATGRMIPRSPLTITWKEAHAKS